MSCSTCTGMGVLHELGCATGKLEGCTCRRVTCHCKLRGELLLVGPMGTEWYGRDGDEVWTPLRDDSTGQPFGYLSIHVADVLALAQRIGNMPRPEPEEAEKPSLFWRGVSLYRELRDAWQKAGS